MHYLITPDQLFVNYVNSLKQINLPTPNIAKAKTNNKPSCFCINYSLAFIGNIANRMCRIFMLIYQALGLYFVPALWSDCFGLIQLLTL